MTEQQIAARIETIGKSVDNPPGRLRLKIDHDVATKDQIETVSAVLIGRVRFIFQIHVFKPDRLLHVRIDDIQIINMVKIALDIFIIKQPDCPLSINPLTGGPQRAFINVGRKNLDRPSGQFWKIFSQQYGDAVRLLAGRTAR